LKAAACAKVFGEQVSGVAERAELDRALEHVREGDQFTCTKIDRLAPSTDDLLHIAKRLRDKGVRLTMLDHRLDVGDGGPIGELIFAVLGAIAALERSIILTRQRERIEKAKSDGQYKGLLQPARSPRLS
jgi:DNA invertase Pin-like site-specific DNA recombinase